MKTDKYYIIKQMLLQEEKFTYNCLAKQLAISTKTIRNQIPEIEELLNEYNIKVFRSPGFGVQIQGDKADILRAYKDSLEKIKDNKNLRSNIRQNVILYHLLTSERITMRFLENILYITRPSIYNDLKEIQNRLEAFSIEIKQSRKSGISLVTGEKRIRKCLLHFSDDLAKEDINEYQQFPEIIKFMANIFDNQKNFQRTFMTNILDSLQHFADLKPVYDEVERNITFLIITFERIKKGYFVTLNKNIENNIKNQKVLEFFLLKQDEINRKFAITLTKTEIIYIASVLSTNNSKSFDSAYQESSNPKLLMEIIEEFYRELQKYIIYFDIEPFKNQLFPFLEKLLQKSNFDLDVFNPNQEKIENNYAKLNKLAYLINPIMKRKVNEELPASAIASITLLLANIKEVNTKSITVYYVVNNGIFEKDLNIRLLKNNIPNIKVITDEQIHYRYEKNIDFILSSNPILKIETPVLLAPALFDREFIQLLKKNVEEIQEQKKERFYRKCEQ